MFAISGRGQGYEEMRERVLQADQQGDKKNAWAGPRRNRRSCNYTVILLPKRMRDDGSWYTWKWLPETAGILPWIWMKIRRRQITAATRTSIYCWPQKPVKGWVVHGISINEEFVACCLVERQPMPVLLPDSGPPGSVSLTPSTAIRFMAWPDENIPGRLVHAIRAASKSCHQEILLEIQHRDIGAEELRSTVRWNCFGVIGLVEVQLCQISNDCYEI